VDQRQKVVDANLRFYESRAETYRDGRAAAAFRTRYDAKFARGFAALRQPRRALDCCAGAGLVTRLLLDRGCEVTAVDLSPRMVDLIRTTVVEPGERVELVCSEITDFLANRDDRWDVAVFGSAIHHLWNFDEVLDLALRRLTPGGSVYLIGEPARQHTRSGRAVRTLELWLRRLSRGPGAIVAGARRRLAFLVTKTRAGRPAPDSAIGFFAEVYANGLPFERIHRVLDRHGARVVWQEAVLTGPAPIRALKRLVRSYAGDSVWLVATLAVPSHAAAPPPGADGHARTDDSSADTAPRTR
jgi:SAM-dependent methyltransferase